MACQGHIFVHARRRLNVTMGSRSKYFGILATLLLKPQDLKPLLGTSRALYGLRTHRTQETPCLPPPQVPAHAARLQSDQCLLFAFCTACGQAQETVSLSPAIIAKCQRCDFNTPQLARSLIPRLLRIPRYHILDSNNLSRLRVRVCAIEVYLWAGSKHDNCANAC